MAPSSNLMADLAQMANGAASAFGGMREEVDNLIRQRMERSLNARGLVTREEFDALAHAMRHWRRACASQIDESVQHRVAGQNNGKGETDIKTQGRPKKIAKIVNN